MSIIRKGVMKTIKEIRQANGMTQEQFAQYLQTSYRSFQDKEAGKTRFTFKEIVKASKLNEGQVKVETEEGSYDVIIR